MSSIILYGKASNSLLIQSCLAKYCTRKPHSGLENLRQTILMATSSFLYSRMAIWHFLICCLKTMREFILPPQHCNGDQYWTLLRPDTCLSKMRTVQPTSTTLPRKIQAQKKLSTTWLELMLMEALVGTPQVVGMRAVLHHGLKCKAFPMIFVVH